MLSIAARITRAVTTLRTAIALFVDRQTRARQVVWLGTQAYSTRPAPGQPPPLPDAVWAAFWRRLPRLSARFERLYDLWRRSALPKPRPPRAPTSSPQSAPPHTAPRGTAPAMPPRLPRAFGWVTRHIRDHTPPTGIVDDVLRDPETPALLAAAPQAGRLLRPLCHALGLPLPPWLRLPPRPRPRKSPPPKARMAATAPPRPELTPDRPLPDYVRAAVLAWKPKFG